MLDTGDEVVTQPDRGPVATGLTFSAKDRRQSTCSKVFRVLQWKAWRIRKPFGKGNELPLGSGQPTLMSKCELC